MTKEEKQRALALRIAKVANQIVPELARLTACTEFQVTILNDGEGFGMQVFVSGEVQVSSIVIPELIKRNEDDFKVEEVAEGVRIEDVEKERLAKALQQTNGDKRKAAELVGLSERTFFRKCKEYGIKK